MKNLMIHEMEWKLTRRTVLALAGALALTFGLPACKTTGTDELTVVEGRMSPKLANIRAKDAAARQLAAEERALAQLDIAMPEPDFGLIPDGVPKEAKFTPRGGVVKRIP